MGMYKAAQLAERRHTRHLRRATAALVLFLCASFALTGGAASAYPTVCANAANTFHPGSQYNVHLTGQVDANPPYPFHAVNLSVTFTDDNSNSASYYFSSAATIPQWTWQGNLTAGQHYQVTVHNRDQQCPDVTFSLYTPGSNGPGAQLCAQTGFTLMWGLGSGIGQLGAGPWTVGIRLPGASTWVTTNTQTSAGWDGSWRFGSGTLSGNTEYEWAIVHGSTIGDPDASMTFHGAATLP